MTKTEVCATTKRVGFHYWKGAPEDVSYLKHRHRHEFNFRVWVLVTEENREVEFHRLQRSLTILLDSLFPARDRGELEFGERSCETIAQLILDHSDRLLGDVTQIEVFEDNENGARLTVVDG